MKYFYFLTALLLMISTSSYADIKVTNNTDLPATAYAKSSPCSSSAGNAGIVQPHSSINVSSFIIGTYCGFFDCEAHVFMTNNCWQSGKEVVIATINASKGVISIKNLDPEHYRTSGSANNVSIYSVKKDTNKPWYDFWW